MALMKSGCIICDSLNVSLLRRNYPGYVEGSLFDIYHCKNCNTNFIQLDEFDDSIYDIIYSNSDTLGYDRYLEYAEKVKLFSDPLKFLASIEAPYYAVYKYLKEKKVDKILEIGCGYGYLTYAMNKIGLNAKGIDLSAKAINYAKSNFGSFYLNSDLNGYSKSQSDKYDLIIATEVIEHTKNPVVFLSQCINLLKPQGAILLTTPNKDFAPQNSVWQTDLPPVHIVWLSSVSFKFIAEKLKLNMKEINFDKFYPSSENKIVRFIRSRREEVQLPILLADGSLNHSRYNVQFSKLHVFMRKFMHNFLPVRQFSNFIFNIFSKKYNTLAVVLSRK